MYIRKRLISAILAALMLVSLLPTVYAENGAENEPVAEPSVQADNGDGMTMPSQPSQDSEEEISPSPTPVPEISPSPLPSAPVDSNGGGEACPDGIEKDGSAGSEPEDGSGEEPAGGNTAPEDIPPEGDTPSDDGTKDEPAGTGDSDSTDEPTENKPGQEEEPASDEEEAENNNSVTLPYGFAGMPEGYVLSPAELEKKAALSLDGTVDLLSKLRHGVDYSEGELIFSCTDANHAQAVAQAYCAELTDLSYGVALIKLSTASTLQAVEAAADMSLPLPAVYPNYINAIAPIVSGAGVAQSSYSAFFSLPERQSWEIWVHENLSHPDSFISSPGSVNYQWMHDSVNSYEAWGVSTGNESVKVAVIDTGIYSVHEEFAGRAGTVDIGLGTEDETGHGTHVAGIIGAALDNGTGGAGIAPGVSILSIKAGSYYGLYDRDVARAINAAVDNGAWIINMSLSSDFPNQTVREAVDRATNAGVTIIAAMGNDGTNAMRYPAAYDGVIAVCATDKAGYRSAFSNYGAWADISAPGQNILSCSNDGQYAFMDGTSMACPVVAGVAALYMSAVGRMSPSELERLIKNSAAPVKGSGMGAGIVDAAKMFDRGNEPPEPYSLTAGEGAAPIENGSTVSSLDSLVLRCPRTDENSLTLYTINGKTPSVRNGSVVNGTVYDGSPIPLEEYAGKSILLRTATVGGMGSISKTALYRLNVRRDFREGELSAVISGPSTVTAGSSVSFQAAVEPAELATQGFIWSILQRQGDMENASISISGELETEPGKSGTITLLAQSSAYPQLSATHDVTVEPGNPTAKLSLDSTALKLNTGDEHILSATALDRDGQSINFDNGDYLWSSSNRKVATVDECGRLLAIARGSAVISCKALDGSGKTARCTVSVSQPVQYITLSGQKSIAPGAGGTVKAAVLPANANSKRLIWSLENAPEGSSVNQSGYVKIPAGAPEGSFSVVASATDGSGVTASYEMRIAPKCKTLSIMPADESGLKRTLDSMGRVKAVSLFEAHENPAFVRFNAEAVCTGNSTPLSWTSSNSKIATVDENGCVSAVSKGSCTIYCKTQDGSGKTAAFTLTVLRPVESISLSGQLTVSPGATARLKAVTLPSSASSRKLIYSLENAPEGISVNAAGIVSVARVVGEGSFTVVATAADGGGVSARYDMRVAPKVADVFVDVKYSGSQISGNDSVYFPGTDVVRLNYNSRGYLSSVNLFTTDMNAGALYRQVALEAVTLPHEAPCLWSSSNPRVASVDENGLVTAVGKGSTNIICTAQDGSGKRAIVRLSVKIPVSSLSIVSSSTQTASGPARAAIGKTLSHSAVFSDSFGTPGNKKLRWSLELYMEDSSGNKTDVSELAISGKYVSLSGSRLYVSTKAKTLWAEAVSAGMELYAVVRAESTDGSGASAQYRYLIVPAAGFLKTYKDSGKLTVPAGYLSFGIVESDVHCPFGNAAMHCLSAGSSNPAVASVVSVKPYTYQDEDGNSHVVQGCYCVEFSALSPGSARISLKANDGSGKSCYFTVIVE